jgi:MoaA/NifB/PqqE/SkfB family radical SAM enzyme
MDSFGFQWHVTDRCPGKCRHCYQNRFDGGTELSLDALKGIADDIMESLAGVPVTINVTGGEPLLYPGLFGLMEHLSSFDNLEELNIITATYGMDLSVIEKLKSIPKLTSVKVSLESDDPSINDDIRGRGYFDMASRNIKMLAGAGLPVMVIATLGKHNYRSVEGLCALAAGLGASGVIFERFVPVPGSRGMGLSGMALTSSEWDDILAAIIRAAGAGSEISIDDLLPYKAFCIEIEVGSIRSRFPVLGAPCCLGASSMALMPDGTVYPCRRFPEPIGKLPDDSMDGILDMLGRYSSHQQKCFDFGF